MNKCVGILIYNTSLYFKGFLQIVNLLCGEPNENKIDLIWNLGNLRKLCLFKEILTLIRLKFWLDENDRIDYRINSWKNK